MSAKFDDVLTELAGQAGGLDPLFDSFFGFLYRKTDFYVQFENKNTSYKMGFPKGEAERMLLKAFRKYEFRNAEPSDQRAGSSSSSSQPATKKPATAPASVVKPTEPSSTAKQTVFKTPNSDSEATTVQTPIGNGGIGKNYYWTQSLTELNVYIDTKPNVKSKQVKCNIAPRSISVQVDNETLLEGSFEDVVKATESMWTLCSGDEGAGYEGGGGGGGGPQIIITLDKTRHTWWKSVVVGDPEIDTTKVDSSRNITDYDESTQATIRKLMHDQNQKRLGLPLSADSHLDEIDGYDNYVNKYLSAVKNQGLHIMEAKKKPTQFQTKCKDLHQAALKCAESNQGGPRCRELFTSYKKCREEETEAILQEKIKKGGSFA